MDPIRFDRLSKRWTTHRQALGAGLAATGLLASTSSREAISATASAFLAGQHPGADRAPRPPPPGPPGPRLRMSVFAP